MGAFANKLVCEKYGDINYKEHEFLDFSDGSFNILGINK